MKQSAQQRAYSLEQKLQRHDAIVCYFPESHRPILLFSGNGRSRSAKTSATPEMITREFKDTRDKLEIIKSMAVNTLPGLSRN